MRYVMRQKLLSLADSFTIKDENERDAYVVKGKVFSIGDKLSFQDPAGNELVYIDQRLLNWSPTYELWRGADLLAVVKRELFSFIHHRFTVDVPAPTISKPRGISWITSTPSRAVSTSWPPCPRSGSAGRIRTESRSRTAKIPF